VTRRIAGALDALAGGAIVLAAGLLLFGPWRQVLAGAPVSLRWTHAAFAGLALLAVRHAAIPAPSTWTALRGLGRSIGRRPALADALLAFGLTRPAVLIVGLAAAATFGVQPSSDLRPNPRHALRELPARFDANWYAGIALDGYQWERSFERQQNIAFFPALPMLMRGAGAITGAFDPRLPRSRRIVRLAWAGLGIALAAFAFAAWYFGRLARELVEPDRARGAVFLLAAYPFSIFYSAAYTESLFLVAALGAWYHARHGAYGRAAAWGLLAGLSRPNGFLVALPLGLIALGMRDGPRAPAARARRLPGFPRPVSWPGVAAAAMPAAGMLLYTVWLYLDTGVLFAWARVHAAWGRELGAAAPEIPSGALSSGLVGLALDHPYQALNALGLAFALSFVPAIWTRLGPAWTAFVLVSLLAPLLAGGLLSMGRLTSTLFPVFLALAAVLPSRAVAPVAAAFGLLQGLNAALFYTWRDMY